MQLGQRARDREPEAGALVAAGHVALDLLEGTADPVEFFARDADAGVLDIDVERIAGLAQADRDPAAFGRELGGVVNQIADDLVERVGIGHEVQVDRPVDAEFDALALDLVARAAHRLLDDEADRDTRLFQLQPAGFDARHVEDVVDDGQQIAAALPDVAGIVEIAVAAEAAEQAVLHDLGEADDRVEWRPQLMAHIGEEFGLGAVGRFGRRLLLEIALGHVGELLRLRLQRLARGLEVGDVHHELVLRLRQPLLLLLQLGDVGADRDRAAILGAPTVDLEPAAVREPRLVGARADAAALRPDRLAVHVGLGADRHDLVMGHAGVERLGRQLVKLLVFCIAENEAVRGVPEHEGFRDRLDRVAQMGVGRGGALGHAALLGDVDRDADEVLRAGAPVDHQFGAGLEPEPSAIGAAHAELLVEMIGLAAADRIGQRVEIGVLGVDEAGDLAEGHVVAGAVVAEHSIHRVGPVDPAAREVPVPQAAMAPVQRGVDALAHAVAVVVGGAGAPRLHQEGERDRAEDDRGGGEQARQRAAALLPDPEQAGGRLDHGDLAEWSGEVADHGERILMAGQGDPHHPGLVAEGGQQLGLPQHVDQRPPLSGGEGGLAGDDVAIGGGDVDAAAMGGEASRRERGKNSRRGDLRPRSIVELQRDQRGKDFEVPDGIVEDIVAHAAGLDESTRAEDDQEQCDERRDDLAEGRFEVFESAVERMRQRSCDT